MTVRITLLVPPDHERVIKTIAQIKRTFNGSLKLKDITPDGEYIFVDQKDKDTDNGQMDE
jgi:hypothetical protein